MNPFSPSRANPSPYWAPRVTVAVVAEKNGELLLVEEQINGQCVLNQPAGHLEPDESLLDAAVRETLEETGWTVELTALIGAYQWQVPGSPESGTHRQYLRIAFAARPIAHDPARPLDTGIVRALWLSPPALLAEKARHRSPLVWQIVADYLGGQRAPLSLVRSL